MINLSNELKENNYPGRGVMIGISEDGENVCFAYFIMGRSTNSRNRVFVLEGEDMRTKAYDESKLEDPSLIIYYPVRNVDNNIIVTNGDQTDTVADFLKKGGTFEQALNTREFEPDAPNLTPRISGMITLNDGKASYKLSILKSYENDPETNLRYYFNYDEPKAGVGHFIHTYKCDGNPLPSFAGEPKAFPVPNDIDAFANDLWTNLNEENKVSLIVRYTNIKTGKSETRLFNKLEGN